MHETPSPVEVFRALGDEQRLRILEFVATTDPACCSTGRGICGCDVEGAVGLAQATVSHHMKVLVQAGLVCVERRGRNNFYALHPAGFALARDIASRFLSVAPSPDPADQEVA